MDPFIVNPSTMEDALESTRREVEVAIRKEIRTGQFRREAKRRMKEEENFGAEFETAHQRASKIPKFSFPSFKPASCLQLNPKFGDVVEDGVFHPKNEAFRSSLAILSGNSNCCAWMQPVHYGPAPTRVECRSRRRRHHNLLLLDPNKRKSLTILESPPALPSDRRPRSMAAPPLTVPVTSSLKEFKFQPDMTSCFSSDSGFSSSSSAQKSSISSIPSSLASLSVAPQSSSSASSSSLHSLEVPNPPAPFSSPVSASFAAPVQPPPSPATPTDSDESSSTLPACLLRNGAGRHSSRDDELRADARTTQLAVSIDRLWRDDIDDVSANFKSMTIDRKCLRDKALSAGKSKFNLNPAKGIDYLVQAGLIKGSSDAVAEFLYRGDGLKKSSIGDFLGERKEFNIEVLRAFVNLHNFKDTTLVQALRQFLWSFRLPGESQKIDRIMEHFSVKYCSDNPQQYSSSDTCYVLSFALVMLNTSLHNGSVKDKLTPERFENMVGIICQDDKVTGDQLMVMYRSIKKEPLRFPEESGPDDYISTFFNPAKEGWLYKKSEKYNQWKKRWFVMSNGCLYYFTYKTDHHPRAIVPLENLTAFKTRDKKKEHCLEIVSTSSMKFNCDDNNNDISHNNNSHNNNNINNNNNNNNGNTSTGIIKSCKTQAFGKVVEGTRTSFKLAAFSAEDCQEWIDCINRNTTNNPLQKLMVERRSKNLLSVRSRKKITSVISPIVLDDLQRTLESSDRQPMTPVFRPMEIISGGAQPMASLVVSDVQPMATLVFDETKPTRPLVSTYVRPMMSLAISDLQPVVFDACSTEIMEKETRV